VHQRGDLTTILDKALAKDPHRRYRSAAELGDDARRFRDHQPIHARAPSAAYQLRKFVRRHRGLVAACSAVLLLLIGGIATSLVLWRTAEEAAVQAQREAEEADAAREFLQGVLMLASPKHQKGKSRRCATRSASRCSA
jgi:serine/threonine-protein kinase